MSHDDCLFCKIIAGDIPSAKVYEDDDVYVFMDISQVTTGHTLIIPKKHYRNIYDLPEDVAEKLFARVPKIANAIKDAFNPAGMNIINNCEAPAGQTVFHLHIHFVPRYGSDDGLGIKWIPRVEEFTPEKLVELATQIKEHIK